MTRDVQDIRGHGRMEGVSESTEESAAEQVDGSSPAAEGVPQDPTALKLTGRQNSRLGQTVGDMTRSIVIVLVVVGAVLLVTWRPQPDAVKAIDPLPELTSARATAGFEVLYPEDLGDGWVPTSARWDLPDAADPDPAWHVGFVAPGERYVQIGQSATTNPDYLPSQTLGGVPVGEGPAGWQRYETVGDDPTRSLVTVIDGVTLVVSGTASWEVLIDVATRLSPTALP